MTKIEISEEMKYPVYKEFRPEFYEGRLVPYTEKEKRIKMMKQNSKTRKEYHSR